MIAEHAAVGGSVASATGEIVKGLFGYPNDVIAQELRALAGAVLGAH